MGWVGLGGKESIWLESASNKIIMAGWGQNNLPLMANRSQLQTLISYTSSPRRSHPSAEPLSAFITVRSSLSLEGGRQGEPLDEMAGLGVRRSFADTMSERKVIQVTVHDCVEANEL